MAFDPADFDNPWTDAGWNVTKQGSILKNQGHEAASAMAAKAGRRLGQTKNPQSQSQSQSQRAKNQQLTIKRGTQGPVGPVGPVGDIGPMGEVDWTNCPDYFITNVAGQVTEILDTVIVGATGPAGPTGPQGIQGFVGDDGPQGIAGSPGATGAQGIQGLIGDEGPQGATGPQGVQGIPGVTGLAGATRATGIAGAVGAVGAVGAQGPQGIAGLVGATGATGVAGAVGAQGPQGIAGLAGAAGAAGAKGATGAQGPAGPNNVATVLRYAQTSNITIAASTWTQLKSTGLVEVTDTQSAYNTTTGKWTPTVPGLYYVKFQTSPTVALATLASILALKNATTISGYANIVLGNTTPVSDGITTASLFVSDIIYMNGTTDYLTFWAYSGGGVLDESGNTGFSAVYLGAGP